MFLNLCFKKEERKKNTGCMPSLIWCLFHVGFVKKNGRLEGSVLDECGKIDGKQMSRGDGCLWLMAAWSIAGVQKDPSFQLNYAFGENPLLDTGDSGPRCPGVEWMTFDFWLKECLPDPYQLLEIFYHN